MDRSSKTGRPIGRALALALGALAAALFAPAARAAGPPVIGATWAAAVGASTAQLHGEANPEGLPSTYHFSYLTQAAYNANLAAGKEAFSGAARMPVAADASIGSGTAMVGFSQKPSGLIPETTYRYRVVAKNGSATVAGETFTFATQALGGGPALLDNRGWEMVSPIDKNGGQVEPAGALAGGGVLQGSADGQAVTYGSAASFGAGAAGSPPASQYLSTRTPAGWSTANITAPIFSATYDTLDQGVPYRLFSTDLAAGLLLNGDHCRGEASGCAVANPPLAGTDAPAGYQNYYLRSGASGAYQALLGPAEAARTPLGPAAFDLGLAGASADLAHVVLSSCAALSAEAIEVPLGGGCDGARQNLYEWNQGTGGLALVNVLPAQSQGTPGAALGAAAGAISDDGGRVYWQGLATGRLYLREGTTTKALGTEAAGFQTATPDGAYAYYLKAAHLYRYNATTEASEDLSPEGGVAGMLGASPDGAYAYYTGDFGLRAWHAGQSTEIAPAADPGNYPPSTGTARLSADGTRLAFLTEVMPTNYDNTGQLSGKPAAELYLYDALKDSLRCASCNPTNARPLGPATMPGAIANGKGPAATTIYKPRALSADGRRVFFESADALVAADTNNEADVYEYEERGVGSCTRSGGCLGLVSSGRASEAASFVDASADGQDAFFLTGDSLVGPDPGASDLYDARVGGGFAEAPEPIPCHGNDCQVLPPEPIDPGLNTLLAGKGNPAVRYHRIGQKPKPHKKHKHKQGKGKGNKNKRDKGGRR